MKLAVVFSLFVCLYLTDFAVGQTTSAMTISEATTFCETAVPLYCIGTTCPLYCNSLRSRRQRGLCNEGCTATNRCQLRPVGAGDDPTNRVLDAQSRDQLFACIAEKRDPAGSTTGRRMTPWEQIRTPSFRKAVRP